jgi:PBP1b-binding outer membrane lipoprotein LpoB
MLPPKAFKLIIVSISLAFLLNGCGATRPVTSTGRVQAPAASSQEEIEQPVFQSPPQELVEQEIDESAQTS